MEATERHERIRQLQAEMDEALTQRAKYEAQFDQLHLEYEALTTDCYDEDCPCTWDDGNNRCTSGQTF